jgi:hypothetical protein
MTNYIDAKNKFYDLIITYLIILFVLIVDKTFKYFGMELNIFGVITAMLIIVSYQYYKLKKIGNK